MGSMVWKMGGRKFGRRGMEEESERGEEEEVAVVVTARQERGRGEWKSTMVKTNRWLGRHTL